MLGSTNPHSVKEGGTQEGLALLLQIKRMTWICSLSSLTASFKLLILKQDKQRINNLAEHRESGSSQGKGNREASAASLPGSWVRISPTPLPLPCTLETMFPEASCVHLSLQKCSAVSGYAQFSYRNKVILKPNFPLHCLN